MAEPNASVGQFPRASCRVLRKRGLAIRDKFGLKGFGKTANGIQIGQGFGKIANGIESVQGFGKIANGKMHSGNMKTAESGKCIRENSKRETPKDRADGVSSNGNRAIRGCGWPATRETTKRETQCPKRNCMNHPTVLSSNSVYPENK
jgi:hypothetical protein